MKYIYHFMCVLLIVGGGLYAATKPISKKTDLTQEAYVLIDSILKASQGDWWHHPLPSQLEALFESRKSEMDSIDPRSLFYVLVCEARNYSSESPEAALTICRIILKNIRSDLLSEKSPILTLATCFAVPLDYVKESTRTCVSKIIAEILKKSPRLVHIKGCSGSKQGTLAPPSQTPLLYAIERYRALELESRIIAGILILIDKQSWARERVISFIEQGALLNDDFNELDPARVAEARHAADDCATIAGPLFDYVQQEETCAMRRKVLYAFFRGYRHGLYYPKLQNRPLPIIVSYCTWNVFRLPEKA